MFGIIYSFEVKPGQKQKFEKAWKDMTTLIYEHEGSLGSRLHRQKKQTYIAYAQWPTKETWQNSGDKLPATAVEVRKAMRESCENITVLFELDVVDDLLKEAVYTQNS